MKNNSFIPKIGIISIIFLTAFTIFAFTFQREIIEDSENTSEENTTSALTENDKLTINLVNTLTKRMENQGKVDKSIQSELETGSYTSGNPYIILDPYGQSPLTALICFATEEPARVEILVEGVDNYTEVSHQFPSLATSHIIPVYGLYPDQLNGVTINVFDQKDNLIDRNICEIQTEPLLNSLQSMIILTETFEENGQDGMTFLSGSQTIAFDKNGDIRWYLSDNNSIISTEYQFSDNHFLVTSGSQSAGSVLFMEMDKLGKIYECYYSPYGMQYDITLTDENTILAIGQNDIADTILDFIYEIERETGEIIHTMDMNTVLQQSRTPWKIEVETEEENTALLDWAHLNSIAMDGEAVFISCDYQSAIVKMDLKTDEIIWILGNHDGWNSRLQPYLLTPVGSNFEWQYNQSAVTLLPDYDNNTETVDILVFDNGSTRFYQDLELQRQIRNNETVQPASYARLVHYRINETTMQVEQIWEYGADRSLVSRFGGSAQLLDNGNILSVFPQSDAQYDYPILVEISSDGSLVWEAEMIIKSNDFDGYNVYRTLLYDENEEQYALGATVNLLIPEDVLKFVAEAG